MMRVLFFISICFVFVMSVSFADSALVEAAKKEKERRAKIEANKSFTNKDVEEWKEKHKDEFGTETAPAQSQPAETPKTEASKDKAKEEDDHSTDEQYWRNKYAAAIARVQAAQQKVDEMQGYVNQWQTLGYNQADAGVRGQQLDQLDKAKEQLEAAKQAVADLQDEARRAGAPPGWVSD